MQIERRTVKGEVRSKGGDTPGIAGYTAVFNQEYDMGWGLIETIKPGAFTRALQEKQDVRCLFNHDPSNLLSRTKPGTLRLSQDDQGLSYESDTNMDTTVGRDVQSMVDRGDLDGCSFGFVVTKQSWRDEFDENGRCIKSFRDIEDVDLYDVGPVTYPAYMGTSVSARSLWPNGIPEEVRSHVLALRDAGNPRRKRDDGDDCVCPCGPCQDGDCAGCDHDGCDCEGCSCEAAEGRAWRRKTEARLAVAQRANR